MPLACFCFSLVDSPALQTNDLRERSSVLLPGVDEGPSCWEPQNREPLEASQSTGGGAGVGFEARGQRPAPCRGMSGQEARAQGRLGPSSLTHQDPRIQEQQELQSGREKGRACLSQSSSPRDTGRAPSPQQRAARERPPPPGSPGHPASPGGGPAITLFPLGLPKAPGACPQAQDAGHLLSPSGSGSATEPEDARQCRGRPPQSDPLSPFADV